MEGKKKKIKRRSGMTIEKWKMADGRLLFLILLKAHNFESVKNSLKAHKKF